MDIAIRVDASANIGFGHFKRCLSLANALETLGSRVVFVSRNLGIDVRQLAAAGGFQSIVLGRPGRDSRVASGGRPRHAAWAQVNWQTDARDTIEALSSFVPAVVIVDHYAFDARWHSVVRQHLNSILVVIDDLADRPILADVLIDHNLDALDIAKYAGQVSSKTRLLVGPRFALLGPSYRNLRKYRFREVVKSIGIFMGGIDEGGLSKVALRGCREIAGFKGLIEIASTSANIRLDELRRLESESVSTKVVVDLPSLVDFFARHDIQIGAGGGAAMERAAVGVPSLLLVTAENQRRVVCELVSIEAAAALELGSTLSLHTIGEAVTRLLESPANRRKLAENSSRLVDGRGATRVAAHVLRGEIMIRPAIMDDIGMMFEWRNHPSTRSMSRNSAPLNPESHANWVMQALEDRGRLLLIGYIGALNVGVVRFDELTDNVVEVSIYLDPDLHGVGLSKTFLTAAECFLAQSQRRAIHLVATVLNMNAGSRKLFKSCAYRFYDDFWRKSIAAP